MVLFVFNVVFYISIFGLERIVILNRCLKKDFLNIFMFYLIYILGVCWRDYYLDFLDLVIIIIFKIR